ncbi:hypothetical protein D047_3478B, partial [Vibrio parahaemolyticus VPTS-2010_2]
FCSSI